MAEQYQFLRYYLPGSLLLLYTTILTVPNLSPDTFFGPINLERIVAIFVGLLTINYTVGYLIYVPYNYRYEKLAIDPNRRQVIEYINRLAKEANCRDFIKCDAQRKEFLDLVYHSNYRAGSELQIDSDIIATLKNHLSNYAARYVCGTLIPLSLIPVIPFVWYILLRAGIGFTWNVPFSLLVITLILITSLLLSIDRERVLLEAFQLEEFD